MIMVWVLHSGFQIVSCQSNLDEINDMSQRCLHETWLQFEFFVLRDATAQVAKYGMIRVWELN